MIFQAHGITDAGRVRAENQDRILMLDRFGCFAAWDGMGGQRCGDVVGQPAGVHARRSGREVRRRSR